MRKRIFHACCSLDGAANKAAESGKGGLSTTVVTVNDTPSQGFAHIFRFNLANCSSRPNRATEWHLRRPHGACECEYRIIKG